MLKSIALAAVVALSGGGLALAQDPTGQALVDSLFAQAQTNVLSGARPAAQARGAMAAETMTDHTLNLRAGKSYVIIGMCDEGCSDMDFAIFGPDGTNLGSDTQDDDTPVVILESVSANGQYTAKVLMAACGAATCNYQVRAYEQ